MTQLVETILPTNILRQLEALGVIPVSDDEPIGGVVSTPKHEYKFNTPNLDENGEPDF